MKERSVLEWLCIGRFSGRDLRNFRRCLAVFRIHSRAGYVYQVHITSLYKMQEHRFSLLKENGSENVTEIMCIPFKPPFDIYDIRLLIQDLVIWTTYKKRQRFFIATDYENDPDIEQVIIERIMLFHIYVA